VLVVVLELLLLVLPPDGGLILTDGGCTTVVLLGGDAGAETMVVLGLSTPGRRKKNPATMATKITATRPMAIAELPVSRASGS
jgi:hypothetical protein